MFELHCASQGWSYEVIYDLGSGMNYQKWGLRQLLTGIIDGDIERLVQPSKRGTSSDREGQRNITAESEQLTWYSPSTRTPRTVTVHFDDYRDVFSVHLIESSYQMWLVFLRFMWITGYGTPRYP